MTNLIGAGVLPKAYHTTERQWYFLLGKEAFGVDKGKWSDFGGRPIGKETPIEIAAREGAEESRGVLGTAREIKNLIENNPDCILTRVPKGKESYYFLYIYPVVTEKMNCESQDGCKCLVCSFAARTTEINSKDVSWKEKSELNWVPAHTVFQAVQAKKQTIMVGNHQYELRNAFTFAMKSVSTYRNYVRSHKPSEQPSSVSSQPTPPRQRFKFDLKAKPFVPTFDEEAPEIPSSRYSFAGKTDFKLDTAALPIKPWSDDKNSQRAIPRPCVLSFSEDAGMAFEPGKYSFMDDFDKEEMSKT